MSALGRSHSLTDQNGLTPALTDVLHGDSERQLFIQRI
ncbi:hypothetical protein SBBP2_1970001 [Burkholderiales bacterium]|nr:hypothetical protein SBBP2_1970001 [Burkholderiales bacterium]